MGSFRVVADHKRRFGGTLAEYQWQDDDGVPVLVSILLDDAGDFFELDSWKVNFGPLKGLPR